MSVDEEQREQQSPNESTASERSASSDQSGPIYRVNRLGREIFAGNKALLITAIQSRRVRGDDLIYDQAQDLWGFARKHAVFLEATGQGLEESQRNRETDSSLGKWLRFLVNAAAIGIILYLLISYSEKIEFKLKEEATEMSSRPDLRSSKSSADSEGSGAGSGEGEGGGGQGSGGGADSGNGKPQRQEFSRREIKQIFDLNAEGMRDAALVLENTLSDEELLSQVQYVSAVTTSTLRDEGKVDQQSFNRLQEARAIATFVAMRNNKHKGARLLLSQINHQLKQVCAFIYSDQFCALKRDHPDWRDSAITAILNREVLYGMTPPQVEAAWGRASRIRRERDGYRYCYGAGCDRSVWMTSGHVREISPSPEEARRRLEAKKDQARRGKTRKRRRRAKRRGGQ